MRLDAADFKGHIAAVTDDVDLAETTHETARRRPEIRWGVAASVLLHVPIVALLIFGLPKMELKPPEDETVKVELVPPPEEKTPEPKPKEKPPEPKPPEEAKKASPPPPPPPPPPAKKPSEQAKWKPMPTLNPVTEFGSRNSGPDEFMAGNSSQGERKPATTTPQRDNASEQMPTRAAAAKSKTEAPPSKPVPDDVKLPEVAAMAVSPEAKGPPTEASDEANTTIEQGELPEQKTADKPKTLPDSNDLREAKTLFSRMADGSLFAQTAMDGLSRKQRVATLCTTELQGQLIHGSPAYFPLALPSFGLRTGTVLDVRDAAFGTAKGWFQVRFRCEVDQGATKVVSFAHQVGGLIPRGQYAKYEIRD
ncbi:DUF930 domain-containing protein [Rhizobium lentis]|uniref:DUF930 domain-containing protein n=1 Tax=Rhizobium lentis TaxID=1138194 RepID=A0A9Q3M6P5_9HYPH|nr:DUF930 domain-containing protein [Rhizobium lentis]MBX5000001.1 DUF930 domain-containing protein [Rhizobium lentis]MBX5011898.1 DUF930 domain-containing protein [Rhizobium lentis]MBX5014795.1 DUF930 domain-containing protein [Rhizobium lentis]MBX5022276.1 DUF930 domain-containing protein [Rhizobium lentis]MBX5046274.1 DUF930 domain-containing protein [Rhizobium lentis]